MLDIFGALVQGMLGIAIFFAIIYAFVKAALAPVHDKLDRVLAKQDDLANRLVVVEQDKTAQV